MTEQATRYNKGKNRLGLISFPALWEIGRVYTVGCEKYDERNWEKGLPYSQALDCALRHLVKWTVRHRNDEETGLHHLAHAAWNIIAALHMELNYERYKQFDDRPDYTGAVPNRSGGEGAPVQPPPGPRPASVLGVVGKGRVIRDEKPPKWQPTGDWMQEVE